MSVYICCKWVYVFASINECLLVLFVVCFSMLRWLINMCIYVKFFLINICSPNLITNTLIMTICHKNSDIDMSKCIRLGISILLV